MIRSPLNNRIASQLKSVADEFRYETFTKLLRFRYQKRGFQWRSTFSVEMVVAIDRILKPLTLLTLYLLVVIVGEYGYETHL